MDEHGGTAIETAIGAKNDDPDIASKLNAYRLLGKALAKKSTDQPANRPIPAGVTYLAQVMAHDLILTVPTGSPSRPFENLVSRPLMLDSLYGLGPAAVPHLYSRAADRGFRTRFCENMVPEDTGGAVFSPDVFRNKFMTQQIFQDAAILADRRNDSHTIIAQITAVWMRFHNKVMDGLGPEPESTAGRQAQFLTAQKIVRATWHRVLRSDVLKFILHPDVMADEEARQRAKKKLTPRKPTGGARIALRSLHALPLPEYRFNDDVGSRGRLEFMIEIGSERDDRFPGEAWRIEWPLFFDIDGDGSAANRTLYETLFTNALVTGDGANLFVADLARSLKIRQFSAKKSMTEELRKNFEESLFSFVEGNFQGVTVDEGSTEKEDALRLFLETGLPLQLLILQEAQSEAGGAHLGKLGSQLIAPWLMQSLVWAEQQDVLTHEQSAFVKNDFKEVLQVIGQI